MKKKLSRKRNYSFNLIIIGCGFVILMWIVSFMITYPHENAKYRAQSYTDLQEKYDVWTHPATYQFLNTAIIDEVSDVEEYLKLDCQTIKHSDYLRDFIKSLPDSLLSEKDRNYMLRQCSKERFVWDESQLCNCRLLAPCDYSIIKDNDTTNYWEEFRRLYGKYGKHSYSIPLFNKDKSLAIIEHVGVGDYLMGSADIFVFRKVNNNWILIHNHNIWIS